MKDYFDLGDYSRNVSENTQCQMWFDRGMIWLFAYNHEEAISCFEKAIAADNEDILVKFKYWFVVGGIIILRAWGITTNFKT